MPKIVWTLVGKNSGNSTGPTPSLDPAASRLVKPLHMSRDSPCYREKRKKCRCFIDEAVVVEYLIISQL